MTVRKYFVASSQPDRFVEEKECEFKYHNGFAYTQKQKSIKEFHNAISIIEGPDKSILEISSKSPVDLGVKLSAFNLKLGYNGGFYNLENIFQASKVFEHGGPYTDLLNVTPKEAKTDVRLNSSGSLIYFYCFDTKFDINPKTFFYDFIYMKALYSNPPLANEVISYDIFTDIEFNHKKSINCQAHSAALFVSLTRNGDLEKALNNLEYLKSIYSSHDTSEQINFL